MPMSGRALDGHSIHLFCSYLNLDWQTVRAVQDGMQGLVSIGLGQCDMVLEAARFWLVQRVCGAPYGQLFFPQVAGVGFSFNPFVWSNEIDAQAGMLRLVFGLGTRAVDRCDDDYTRVISLSAPERRHSFA